MTSSWHAAVSTRVSINTNSRRTKLAPPLITGEIRARGNFALGLYRTLWRALAPAIPLALSARAARGKEDRTRLQERWGIPTRARPQGELVWIHGASIGECMAALPLVSRLLAKPGRHVLVTSGTVASAQLMAERLPAGALHQYVPIDRRDAVRRFLSHWRPDLALFVESELWPNLLLEARASGVPLALVNARISERSYRGWLKAPGVAARLLGAFDVCLAQNKEIAERLEKLGAHDIRVTGSLKADAALLPVRERDLAAFRAALGGRDVFLAASTHPGEEDIILDVARRLREEGAPALTVIVPRHPERGEEIAYAAASRGATVARRSTGALPDAEATVYIADTFGELGLFYRNARFAFLGGSLIPHGGQNPLEASQLGLAVLAGPHTHNFPDVFRTLLEAQGLGRVTTADEMHALVRRFLLEPGEAERLGARAREAAAGLSGALEATAAMAEQLLASRAHARS
jgi:3-deoxy-D-manno-octulosonic-acid transferase